MRAFIRASGWPLLREYLAVSVQIRFWPVFTIGRLWARRRRLHFHPVRYRRLSRSERPANRGQLTMGTGREVGGRYRQVWSWRHHVLELGPPAATE